MLNTGTNCLQEYHCLLYTSNWYRLCFFWCALGIAAMLIFFREYFGKRIEVGFLVISVTIGTLFSLSLPANKVSWDEEVHFSQSFWLSNYRTPVSVSPAVTQEFIARCV